MKASRICVCCGKEFIYDTERDPAYKYQFCGEDCKKLMKIASDYYDGVDKEKLKDQLGKIEIDSPRDYVSDIKDAILAINKVKPSKRDE